MPPINETTLTFTTTAMPRPEILSRTYDSFTRNLLGLDFKKITLFLNIDRLPGGDDEDRRREVLEVARHYFGTVIVNTPKTSSFSAAVNWCFSQLNTPFNFHLEDDWELLVPIKISMIETLFQPEHIQQVALRSRENVRQDFWLCPALARSEFCRKMARQMNLTENPEVEIRRLKNEDCAYDKSHFVYFPFDFKAMIVQDLGRPWMRSSAFNRGSTHFTSWSIRSPG